MKTRKGLDEHGKEIEIKAGPHADEWEARIRLIVRDELLKLLSGHHASYNEFQRELMNCLSDCSISGFNNPWEK